MFACCQCVFLFFFFVLHLCVITILPGAVIQAGEGGEEDDGEVKGMVNSNSLASLQQSDTDSMVNSASANSLYSLTPSVAPCDDVQAQGDGPESPVSPTSVLPATVAQLKLSETEGTAPAADSVSVNQATDADGTTTTIITIGEENNSLNPESKLLFTVS